MNEQPMIRRRGLLHVALAAIMVPAAMNSRVLAKAGEPFAADLAGLEAGMRGARLGVCVLDAAGVKATGHRMDERFPMCSTFKLLVAGATLARVDRGEEKLENHVAFGEADLVPYSPITGSKQGVGLDIETLCLAAVTASDNTAANLLLARLGGPAGLTAWLRTIGDNVTRLDRIEPALNAAAPGDKRDTTTPRAMTQTIRRLLLGDVLSTTSREHLTDWLVHNTTGGAKLRAGLPVGWRIGEKTGAGSHGTSNDTGIVWPPQGMPLFVASYLTGSRADRGAQDALHAKVGVLIAAHFG
ncbi:class A beta-lactamase [Ancylobacter sp. 6x-1]|uniref:Beta-lactamase n=1 Tax=Ancylobacter crimeensis TaxID=2579147 RepID=A0ABT0DD34_9HYPH|nr:class A beta-lactamase [Ancylobacter crimeensis]MCK0197799.1 class A beta-lactamase [Ancylobacter crimeensis]